MHMLEPLDAQALSKLGQLDPTGASRLVQRVLRTYHGSLTRLRQLIAAGPGDLASLRLGVHTLKSSSASVGALPLSQMCAEAEAAIRDERHAELPDRVARLLVEIERVDDAVRLLIDP